MSDDKTRERSIEDVWREGELGNLSYYAHRVARERDEREASQTAEEALAARQAALAEVRRMYEAGEIPVNREPATQPRRPGRPPWTRGLFLERYREAVDKTPAPRNPDTVAANFRMLDDVIGPTPKHLAKLRRRFGE